ncbi:ubiquitin C-terminal hydrolase 37 [Aspergillus undulatus]|uniref:ubiquitin C-terminal hydrolase 37 n=1 Tax=Aspergillus undulatus TaxID=1810928 RepID=UPI003CCD1869
MSGRVKRRRLNDLADDIDGKIDSYRSASKDDKDSWNGFCELESEPAIFNVMLREFGVTGIKVQEVVSLDEELLAFLNKPVYGLIFLFRWREDDPDKQEASCPEGLWFANQTASNSCASVALLNIVNNIEGADLGENLRSFKDFTMPFTPALRGDAINNFEFVKKIHNSFARRMDILNSDLLLKSEAASKRNRLKKRGREEHEADAGFHFIAFVPALGKVWKFDGLERQPQALGPFEPDSDWLELVKPNIRARMEAYEEDQIEFSILSLARDPLPDLISQLAVNIKQLQSISRTITAGKQREIGADPQTMAFLSDNALLGPDASYEVTERVLEEAAVPVSKQEENIGCSADELVKQGIDLGRAQLELRAAIREEQQSRRADEEYAAGRRYDYGPAIRTWLRLLARKQVIEDLVSKTKEFR